MSANYGNWVQAKKVVVVGAGTMGGGIAAHLANLGFEVTLLDLSKERVEDLFAKTKSAKPPHLLIPEFAHRISLGAIADSEAAIREADWVCEAVVERLDVKRALFEQLEGLIRPDAMISTNTSGLQIGLLTEGRSESFKDRFLGVHFFNPPRYLKLVELIPTPETSKHATEEVTRFLEQRVARRVVLAKDTPGFIANRFGMWAMFQAVHAAEKLGLSVEQVDAITGPFIGRPRTASFRLNDIVGLDIMQDIANNLLERCVDDTHLDALKTPASMQTLLEKGWIGEKAGQGFYRREGKELLFFDFNTKAYRPKLDFRFDSIEALGKLPLAERLSQALALKDEVGEYLRAYLVPALHYADAIKEEISHNVQDFDRVMRWGFGWELGPFETIDAVGASKIGLGDRKFYIGEKMISYSGGTSPVRDEPEFRCIDDFPIVGRHETFLVRDLGKGVHAISLSTKNGVITPPLVAELTRELPKHKGPLVLTSESRHFSFGFDLNFFLEKIAEVDVKAIEAALSALQDLGELLETKPIVAAVRGYCLGAGHELALSCSRIVADSEAPIGLPEAKVGLIPGGRGTVLMRLYNQLSTKKLTDAALSLTEGVTGANAEAAKASGLLRPHDRISFHPDRLLAEACEVALETRPVERPAWRTPDGPLLGLIEKAIQDARQSGRLTEYDELIGAKIKHVFVKPTSYEDARDRERAEFMELCFKALTQARIKHMLETGKPLRN